MSYRYNGGVPQFFTYDVPDCSFCVWIHVCSGLIQDNDFFWCSSTRAKQISCRSPILKFAPFSALYGLFRLSRQKNHIFSLKLTRFIRTPVNRDNGHFSVSRVTNSLCIYCQPRFTDTGYLHTVYFHCHNYVTIVDIVPCSNNDRFLRVNKILLQY